MDHAVLVDIEVNTGAEILNVLDAGPVRMEVALWATFPDYYSPRLVFASKWLDQFSPLTMYGKFHELLDSKFPTPRFPPFFLMETIDPFIKDLRQRLGTIRDVQGMRLGGQSFGDRYVEDGYVYRIE